MKHGVSLRAIAKHSGISVQHLNLMEFGERTVTARQEDKIFHALEHLIAEERVKLRCLEEDLLVHRENLLQPMEVGQDG
jgi:transcriptional regulator with XRE-family HTH domain